ncbi:MAG: carboxymuconolactone decarboxylase family protein [Acidimicrobiales bacterium]
MARLAPLDESDWSDKARQAISPTIQSVAAMLGDEEVARPERKKPLNILLTLAHNDQLIGPFLQWAGALAVHGALDRRDAELLALRAAWNCQSEFEWGHHVEYAEHFGLHRDEIDRVPLGADAPGWMPHQAAVLRAADELHSAALISDSTYAELTATFNPAQLIELVMTVGQYTMLSMVANTFEVAMEPGLESLPSREPL